MNCIHGVRIDKPCPDCEYEDNCRRQGVEPKNRWKLPEQPTHCPYDIGKVGPKTYPGE